MDNIHMLANVEDVFETHAHYTVNDLSPNDAFVRTKRVLQQEEL